MHRRYVEYAIGEDVHLKIKNYALQALLSSKFAPCYVGPFKIQKRIGKVAYKLELLHALKIHLVFYVNLLKPYVHPIDSQIVHWPDPIHLVEGQPEYEVAGILDYCCRRYGRGVRKEYLVAWKDYPVNEATWEPLSNLTNAEDAIQEFHVQ